MTRASDGGAAPDGLRFQATAAHRRRLREVWRSAGWPYQDVLEAELLAAGLLVRDRDAVGRDAVRVTDAGVDLLAQTLRANRAARAPHEALVARVAREMQRAGRVVWLGLSLRARVSAPGSVPGSALDQAHRNAVEPLPPAAPPQGHQVPLLDGMPAEDGGPAGATADEGRWVVAMPDVYSIRNTTVEDYLLPTVHEVKVRRADLLAELRRPAKAQAYRWLAAQCWFVIREGIAEPEEIPPQYGVLVAPETGALVQARAAPCRTMRLPFPVWMALARATPAPTDPQADAQAQLGGMLPPDSGALDGEGANDALP